MEIFSESKELTKSQKIKQYKKDWYKKNKNNLDKEKLKLNKKNHKENNTNKYSETNRNYYIQNKDKISSYKKEWRKNNIEAIRLHKKNKKLTDPLYKLTESIRNAIRRSIKNNGFKKKCKTIEILGCSFDEFKQHIESKWEPWMTWDNYGLYNGELNYGWDLDHIIPTSSAINEEGIIALNHYTNLQPLCSKVNRDIKKAKIT